MSEERHDSSRAESSAHVGRTIDSRLWRALTMIAVAVIAAVLAYMTGTYELRSVQLEREIVQQNLITVTERQRLLDFLEASQELTRRADSYRSLAEWDAAAATQQARSSAQHAELLALQAQEEYAAARALKPFIDATSRLVMTDGPDADTNVRRTVDRFKEARGIANDADSIARLDEAMETAHGRVLTLAAAVVLFILALVTFTLSDVYRAKPERSGTWYAIGVVVAVSAAAFAEWTNPDLYVPLALFALALLVVTSGWFVSSRRAKHAAPAHAEAHATVDGVAAVRVPHQDHPHEEPPHPEIKPEGHRFLGLFSGTRSRYSRAVIYAMAFSVFASALAGFLYTWALIESSTASHRALKQQIELNASITADAESIDVLLHVAEVAEARARSQVLRYKAAYLASNGRGDEAVAATAHANALDEKGRNPLASQWLDHPSFGIDTDPAFPRKLLNQRSAQGGGKANRWESLAMWDAYNHESIRWSELATTLLRALTTLAVALYLLGHAHAVGRSRAGRALAFAGGGLLVWASVSAGDAEWRNWNPAVVEVSDTCNSGLGFASADAPAEVRAARYYASARALLTTAETADQYRAARNALECMSQLRRGETTLPRADFVRAVEMESTSQTGQLWAGLPLKDDLPRITQRMAGVVRQYRSAGETPPSRILASLGRYSWLQAMEERGEDRRSIGDKDDSRRKLLGESVDLLTEAAGAIAATGEGREAQRRRILMSLAIAQYAAGLAQQADATANAALTIPGTGSRRVAGRALTDLELLRNHCRNVRDADYCASLATRIDSLKGRIVATTWQDANMLPVRRSDEVGPAKEMRIEVAADGLQWTLPPLRVTPQQQLALIWYEHDPRWNVWRAMPDVSGPIASSAPAALSYPAASRFERCISGDADVRYRAELYLDGRLVASGIGAPASGQRFKAWVFSDLNIAFCAPAGWSEIDVPQHAEDREMLVRAMGTDAASPTMVLFAFYGFNGTDAVPLQQIDRITEYLVRRGWIAAQTTLARREQSGSCANATKTDLPAYVSRTTNERLRHVAIALRDAEQPDACVALRSVTTRSEPPGIAKALTRPALASR